MATCLDDLHFGDGRDWFFERRFGMFVHWGIYALPGWHEQHQYQLRVPRDEYVKLVSRFNPSAFNPDAWLDLAETAGMRYITFTTKHIDGFCMWDTAHTDYNVTRTPYGRDVLGMLAEACHRRSFPLCLYYSIVDMHQKHYPTAGRRYEKASPDHGDSPDLGRYIEFVRGQVRELCTNYGEIHGFWWDANELEHHDPSVNAMIRQLQPKAVINNRGFDEGDYGTPERESEHALGMTEQHARFPTRIEACNSVGRESWGYRRDENYYSFHHLIDRIDKTLAKGGNYLLNVGPDADGAIPDEAADILKRIGAWYHRVSEAFEGTEPASDLLSGPGVLLTRKGNTLFVHLYGAPETDAVVLPPLLQLPCRAVLLNTGSPVLVTTAPLPRFVNPPRRYLQLRRLPVNEMANEVMVVRLDFDQPLVAREEGVLS